MEDDARHTLDVRQRAEECGGSDGVIDDRLLRMTLSPGSISARLDRLPLSSAHYRLLFIHGLGWLFDALDVGLVTFVMAALIHDWHITVAEVGFIGSAGTFGMLVGAAVSGHVADRFGRKTVFSVTLLLFACASVLCAAAWNVPSMLAFRFLGGVGLGGELPIVSALLSEFTPRRHRGRFVVLLESFWAYGWCLAALVAFLLIPRYGWRLAFLIGGLPALYVAVVRARLPESPRWLASKGRLQEAHVIVSTMEAAAGVPIADPERTDAGAEVRPAAAASPGRIWDEPFRRRTAMLWILWFGLVFGYYGIFVWLPALFVAAGYSVVNSFSYTLIITAAQIPGYWSAALLIERIGRRPVIVGYLTTSAACAYLLGHATTTMGILVWASLMSFFNLGAWGGVYAYSPEQYPTAIRGRGTGAAAAFGRLGGVLAPMLVGLLLPSIGRGGVLAMNAGMLAMAAGAVAVLGRETKGLALDDGDPGEGATLRPGDRMRSIS